MDPNATLTRMRELLSQRDELGWAHLDDAEEYADLGAALDEWLSKGGFLPEAWQR